MYENAGIIIEPVVGNGVDMAPEMVLEEPVTEVPEAPILESEVEEELNDWYGDDPVLEATDWYEEF